MGRTLFANFLEDKRVYHLAQLFWRRYFQGLTDAQKIEYTSYLNTVGEFDGNPIFHAYFPNLQRAIRIIQIDPAEAEGEMDIKAWVDQLELPPSNNAVPELVIDTVLTEGTKAVGMEIIEAWLHLDDYQKKEWQRFLDGLLAP